MTKKLLAILMLSTTLSFSSTGTDGLTDPSIPALSAASPFQFDTSKLNDYSDIKFAPSPTDSENATNGNSRAVVDAANETRLDVAAVNHAISNLHALGFRFDLSALDENAPLVTDAYDLLIEKLLQNITQLKAAMSSDYVARTTVDADYVARTTVDADYVARTTVDADYVARTTVDADYVARTTVDADYVARTTVDADYVARTTVDADYVTKAQRDIEVTAAASSATFPELSVTYAKVVGKSDFKAAQEYIEKGVQNIDLHAKKLISEIESAVHGTSPKMPTRTRTEITEELVNLAGGSRAQIAKRKYLTELSDEDFKSQIEDFTT